jgi:excisionase family DNA binding protein
MRTASNAKRPSLASPALTAVDPEERALSLSEACGVLGVCENTLRSLVRQGNVRCKFVGRRPLFRRRWLMEWLEATK